MTHTAVAAGQLAAMEFRYSLLSNLCASRPGRLRRDAAGAVVLAGGQPAAGRCNAPAAAGAPLRRGAPVRHRAHHAQSAPAVPQVRPGGVRSELPALCKRLVKLQCRVCARATCTKRRHSSQSLDSQAALLEERQAGSPCTAAAQQGHDGGHVGMSSGCGVVS